MQAQDVERRLADVRTRLAKLPPEEQERALDGFAQVLTVLTLPREPGESVSLAIGLERSSGVTHKSG